MSFIKLKFKGILTVATIGIEKGVEEDHSIEKWIKNKSAQILMKILQDDINMMLSFTNLIHVGSSA